MHRNGNKEQIAFAFCNIQCTKKHFKKNPKQVWYVTNPAKQSLLKLSLCSY